MYYSLSNIALPLLLGNVLLQPIEIVSYCLRSKH